MALTIGILGDSYRRQLRRPHARASVDIIFEKVTAVAEEFGIRPIGVDFGVHQLASQDRVYLSELKVRLDEMRMVPTVILGALRLEADREVSEPALDSVIRNLEVAHRLGSPLGLYSFRYGGRVTREGRIRLAIEQVRRLADAAVSYDMRVTTENFDFFTSDDFIEIFDSVGRDNVGLHSDTGNWLLLGEDPLESTRKMAPYTYHAHVRDYVFRDGVYVSVPIGQGTVDFPPILAELKKVDEQRDRMVLAIEMDMDEGDEDQAVRECARYMVDWYARNVKQSSH
jgi:sugar phosphate isomerase/epimerase